MLTCQSLGSVCVDTNYIAISTGRVKIKIMSPSLLNFVFHNFGTETYSDVEEMRGMQVDLKGFV